MLTPKDILLERQALHARELCHAPGRGGVHLAQRLIDCGDDEVLEHVHILGVHGLGVYREPRELVLAAHDGLHDAAAGRRLEARGLKLLLHPAQLLLHLLSLLHHIGLVHAAHAAVAAAETAFCHGIIQPFRQILQMDSRAAPRHCAWAACCRPVVLSLCRAGARPAWRPQPSPRPAPPACSAAPPQKRSRR